MLFFLIAGATLGQSVLGQTEEGDKLVTVTAKAIKLDIPASWEKVETTSPMRAAEFKIPADGEGEGAELVVYHFGGPTGGVKANIERWLGQFYEDGRQHKLFQGKCRGGSYVLVDIAGTYKKPIGPPQAQQSEDKPGSRVIGVVLKTEVDGSEDYYFLKLAGPDALVAGQAAALRKALRVDADSETPLELDDAGE
jgi:gluconolactonase